MPYDIKYQEHSLYSVVDYFVKGFTPVEGTKIVGYDYFVDATKGTMILRLAIEKG